MAQSSGVVVGPSLPRFLATAVLLPVFAGIAVWSIVGVGIVLYTTMAIVGSLGAGAFVVMALTRRPRVVITPEGFTFHKLIGGLSHAWQDIDGPFAIIKIGWSHAVAYRLTAAFKAKAGTRPTSMLQGYDEAIVGAFQVSAEKLAELLNESRAATSK